MSLPATSGLFRRSELQWFDCELHSEKWDRQEHRCQLAEAQIPGLSGSIPPPIPHSPEYFSTSQASALKPEMFCQLEQEKEHWGEARTIYQDNYPDLATRLESREPSAKHKNFYVSLSWNETVKLTKMILCYFHVK